MGDFLFGVTEWLRTTWLLDFAFWIQESKLTEVMVLNFWAVPIAQVFHILSISAAFGAALMLTLRVNNLAGGARTIKQVSDRYIPWVWWGLIAITISGLLMLAAEPIRNMINAVFWLKMVLLVLTLTVTILFQNMVRARAAAHGPEWRATGSERVTSVILLILWCAVMAGGRWIAYAPL